MAFRSSLLPRGGAHPTHWPQQADDPRWGGAREHLHVPTLKLDTIAETQPKPDFIKVDVEGAELAVLEGAANLMSGHHPTFYAEIGQSVFSACADLVHKNGYMIF